MENKNQPELNLESRAEILESKVYPFKPELGLSKEDQQKIKTAKSRLGLAMFQEQGVESIDDSKLLGEMVSYASRIIKIKDSIKPESIESHLDKILLKYHQLNTKKANHITKIFKEMVLDQKPILVKNQTLEEAIDFYENEYLAKSKKE